MENGLRVAGPAMRWTWRDGLAIAALAIAPFAHLWALFTRSAGCARFFPDGDFVDQFYAFATFEARTLAAGRLPLWNPYAYGGGPFWADIQSAVAYPPRLALTLASLALRGELAFRALELDAVAHLALACVLVYIFARHSLRSRIGAAVAALAFGLGGYLTGYPPLQLAVLETDVWLGLALLGASYSLAGSRARLAAHVTGEQARGASVDRAGAAASLCAVARPTVRALLPHPLLPLGLGLAILAGHPQSALYVIYATIAYYAWHAWPWRRAQWQAWLPLATGLALGLGLSAPTWLPAAQLLALSSRASADYAALAHGFAPRELLGLGLPDLTLWSPLYVGVLAMLLALAAAWRALAAADTAARQDRFWLALGTTALLLSLGSATVVFDLFYWLAPGFDLFRGQERAAFLVAFCLAMLAGRGAALWLGGDRRTNGIVLTGSLGLTCTIGALAIGSPPAASGWLVAMGFSLVAASLALALAACRHPLSPVAGVVAALALVAVAFDAPATGTAADLSATPPRELTDCDPVWVLRAAHAQRIANEDRLSANFGVLYSLEATSGASPLRLRSFAELADGLSVANPSRLWDLLAVSHVLTWRDALSEPSRATRLATDEGGSLVLHELIEPNPLLWRASGYEMATDDAASIARLADPRFDLRQTVLLATDPGGGHALPAGCAAPSAPGAEPTRAPLPAPPATAANPASSGAATSEVVSRAPGELVAETSGPQPGWLVFSEMHYPGWQAWLDGQPATVCRADVALMAVAVPAGVHRVRLAFGSPLVSAALAIAVLSIGLLLALVAGWARLGRSAGP